MPRRVGVRGGTDAEAFIGVSPGGPAAADSRGAHARGSVWRGPCFLSRVPLAVGAKMGGGRGASKPIDWELERGRGSPLLALRNRTGLGTPSGFPLGSARLPECRKCPSPACGHPEAPTPLQPPLPVPCRSRRAHPRVPPLGPPRPSCRRALLPGPAVKSEDLASRVVPCWAWAALVGFLFCFYPEVKGLPRSWRSRRDAPPGRRRRCRMGPPLWQ